MNSGGNSKRGKAVFAAATAQCALCHKVRGQGGDCRRARKVDREPVPAGIDRVVSCAELMHGSIEGRRYRVFVLRTAIWRAPARTTRG